jgi:glycine reductase
MAKNKKFRIVHYLNNFFSGFGGEEAANMELKAIEGPIKVGKMVFQPALGETAEIVATIVRGDNGWTTEFIEKTTEQVISLIKKYNPDLVIAGPAFNAGRYGIGCGAIGKAVKEELGIPVVAGMYYENPAIDLYKQYSYIVRTSDNALTTKDDAEEMAALAVKLLSGQEVLPDQDNYIPRFRRNYFAGKTGAERAYEILDNKLAGKPLKTEYPMPEFDRVAPSEPIHDLSKVTVALVTSGGIVPKGNPDRIESSSAQKFGQYSIGGIDRLTAEAFQTAHGGYDPTYANADPHRVLPLDILRDMEKSGIIGKIHDLYYSTVGNGTSVGNSKRFGEEIGKLLVAAGVQAVIMTST